MAELRTWTMAKFRTSALSGILGRIALLSALSAVPITAFLLQTSVELRDVALGATVEDLERTVRAEADDLTERYASLVRLLTALTRHRDVLSVSGDCSSRLTEIVARTSQFMNLYVANASGDMICSADPLEKPINVSDRDYFSLAMKSREPILGEAVLSRRTNRPIIPVALGVPGENGEAVGIVLGSIDIEESLARISRHRGYDDAVITFMTSDGRLIGRLPDLEGAIGQSQADSPLFRAISRASTYGGRTEIEGLDGVRRVYAVADVDFGRRHIWLIAGVARTAIVGDINAAFRQKLWMLALAFALVLFIAIAIGNYALRRPVLRLSRAALRLADGEAGVRVGLHAGASELVELSRNFDRMAEELQLQINTQARINEELRLAKASVEDRIAARTHDLEDLSREASLRSTALAKTTHDLSTLSEMTDLLQTADTLDDATPIIEHAARRLFPNNGGTIFLFRESRNLLEPAGAWGGLTEPHAFAPEGCLAIRLGRTYRKDPDETQVCCRHVGGEMPAYACIPMAAQGVVHGVMTLALGADEAANTDATCLAEMTVERLALAVANVSLRKQLREISIQDSLTGLYNRRFAEEVLSHQIARAAREGSVLCVLMLDVDHFKRFNDTYGHEVGDELLQQAGALLKASFRGSDVCCRYGGEEFLVVMPEADIAGALQRAETLCEEMKRIHFVHNAVVIGKVSVSIGLASYPDPISDGRALVGAADAALYKAKAAGRDRVCVATAASQAA